MTRIMSAVLEDRYTVLIKSGRKLLRKKKLSERVFEKNKTFLFRLMSFSRNRAICVIIRKIMLNQTEQSALCVVDNLGVSRTQNM